MKTKEVKVSELSGSALDWCVAIAEGHKPPLLRVLRGNVALPQEGDDMWCDYLEYSILWELSGPIIEREEILFSGRKGAYLAWLSNRTKINFEYTSETHLIAAMRCYVAYKLGDVVSVPVELLEV